MIIGVPREPKPDVLHYCVTNMPGAVGRTSTSASGNASPPYALRPADLAYRKAAADPELAAGINVQDGEVTHPAVAEAFGMTCHPAKLTGTG